MNASPSTRRLSDKILDAAQLAETQGRGEFASSLKLLQQALLVEELVRQDLRRGTDSALFENAELKH
ncbi:MAG TPA: hypothetical protein VM325_02430 [Alphaproteobacteria bacterium]|nr:hypothetical protein [Alphaproteobacteria bacterium]